LSTYVKTLDYYSINFYMDYCPERISNTLTRGGPLTTSPEGAEASVSFSSDDRKPVTYSFTAYGSKYSVNKDYTISGSVSWKPLTNISCSFEPEFDGVESNSQWVDKYSDKYAVNTYGNRYVFANLNQKTISASIRLNWTFSPALSLQLYMQPYISQGKYYNYKQLRRSKSYDFLIYGRDGSTWDGKNFTADPDGSGPAASIDIDNKDFNYTSLRSNIILRWEYNPGSVIFLVWSQSRTDDVIQDSFLPGRSMRSLFNQHGDNVVMLKFTKWFNI